MRSTCKLGFILRDTPGTCAELGCPKFCYHAHVHCHRGLRLSDSCHHKSSYLAPERKGNRWREFQPCLCRLALQSIVYSASQQYCTQCPLRGHQWWLYRRCTKRIYMVQSMVCLVDTWNVHLWRRRKASLQYNGHTWASVSCAPRSFSMSWCDHSCMFPRKQNIIKAILAAFLAYSGSKTLPLEF